MTNSYAIIRAIAKVEGMTPAERWAGALIAVHLDTQRNQIRVRQSLIAEESGLKERCVRGAVAKMVAANKKLKSSPVTVELPENFISKRSFRPKVKDGFYDSWEWKALRLLL